jgi:ABC-type bacteriocin/lantibiotic exporter with double-glycine peptidase domain
MAKGLSYVLAAALFLGAPACRGLGARSITRADLSAQAVVLDVPGVDQEGRYECGLAAVSALCQYYGVPLGNAARVELARIAREESGLAGSELRAALEEAGFEVFLYPGTLDHGPTGLLTQIDRGRPVLVLISPDGRRYHYSLVVGYDPASSDVVFHDPRQGLALLPDGTFERVWQNARRFALLAVPRAGEPGADGA